MHKHSIPKRRLLWVIFFALNWFWRSSSYLQSRAEAPVLLYRINTYLHMKVIKPLFCLEEGCVPFTAATLSIFPSVILPFSCLLSSNVLLSKSTSQISFFCMSSGLGVVQHPEFFIVWFIFNLYIMVLCSIYLLHIAWLQPHSFWNGNHRFLCFPTVLFYNGLT